MSFIGSAIGRDAPITAALTVFGILIVVFIVVQISKKDTARVPPRITSQRSVASGPWFAFWLGASMLLLVYYLLIWFQAIQGIDAVESGIRVLPMVLSLNLVSVGTGVLIRLTGYSAPLMLLSSIVTAIGTGLITTFKVDTASAKRIGYQVVYGAGIGFGLE
ncbi:MAG: hypothetical protein M1818_005465 [Claussenomyces sp. TS43310]|nr:MAG: hypothetical protein M1818_005465 [Claussenomyces sp. TS43310]